MYEYQLVIYIDHQTFKFNEYLVVPKPFKEKYVKLSLNDSFASLREETMPALFYDIILSCKYATLQPATIPYN